MGNIVIPNELPGLIDRFHFLWNKLRIIKEQHINSDRHALLDTLRSIKEPSELEKRLMEQIEGEEKACLDSDAKLEKAYRDEEAGLYEKVRQACKGMLLGKYIKYLTAWYIIYMRVDKVTMTGRTVYISGKKSAFTGNTTLSNGRAKNNMSYSTSTLSYMGTQRLHWNPWNPNCSILKS